MKKPRIKLFVDKDISDYIQFDGTYISDGKIAILPEKVNILRPSKANKWVKNFRKFTYLPKNKKLEPNCIVEIYHEGKIIKASKMTKKLKTFVPEKLGSPFRKTGLMIRKGEDICHFIRNDEEVMLISDDYFEALDLCPFYKSTKFGNLFDGKGDTQAVIGIDSGKLVAVVIGVVNKRIDKAFEDLNFIREKMALEIIKKV